MQESKENMSHNNEVNIHVHFADMPKLFDAHI